MERLWSDNPGCKQTYHTLRFCRLQFRWERRQVIQIFRINDYILVTPAPHRQRDLQRHEVGCPHPMLSIADRRARMGRLRFNPSDACMMSPSLIDVRSFVPLIQVCVCFEPLKPPPHNFLSSLVSRLPLFGTWQPIDQ